MVWLRDRYEAMDEIISFFVGIVILVPLVAHTVYFWIICCMLSWIFICGKATNIHFDSIINFSIVLQGVYSSTAYSI